MRSIFHFVLLIFTAGLCRAQEGNKSLPLKADFKTVAAAEAARGNAFKSLKNSNPTNLEKAKEYSIIGIYNDLTGNRDSAIYYYNKALLLSKKNTAYYIHSLINLGNAYNCTGQYSKALSLAGTALRLNAKNNNSVDKALIYEVVSVSYFNKNNIKKSVSYILQGISLLEKEKNTKYMASLKVNLANTYIYSNNYSFAADMYQDYLDRYKKDSLSRMYIIAYVNYAETLIALKNYDKAYALLEKNIALAPNYRDPEIEGVAYAKLAKIDKVHNNIEKALKNYEKAYQLLAPRSSKYAMPIISDYLLTLKQAGKYKEALHLIHTFTNSTAYKKATIFDLYDYKQSVARIYAESGKLAESNKALKEAIVISDSLRFLADDEATAEAQARFQTNFQREKNVLLHENNKALSKKVGMEKRMLYMYVIMSISLLVLILLFLRGYWLKNRLQKEMLKSLEIEKKAIEQNHQYEQNITNNQKITIDEKQREVTSMALRLANYYDTLNAIINKCDEGTLIKISDVKKDLQALIKQKDYWNNFETSFNNLNPDFESNLVSLFPGLSKNDIQFCVLLKLNLSYKEIASLLQISYESVVTKKYRVKKKMAITDDAEFEKLLIDL